MEITNTSCAEKDQQPQLSIEEFQATGASSDNQLQPKLSMLTFWKLRYACSRAQELSNEFARLLNRGSSLE